MTNKILLALATAGVLALPMTAQAKGTLRGAAEGAAVGADAAGAVGGIVGDAIGAATGTVGGILGVDERPRFRSYVRDRGVSSYSWGGPVRVGTVLPEDSVTYYDVPTEYRVRPGYRSTIVNEQPVLVDRSHLIVEVID